MGTKLIRIKEMENLYNLFKFIEKKRPDYELPFDLFLKLHDMNEKQIPEKNRNEEVVRYYNKVKDISSIEGNIMRGLVGWMNAENRKKTLDEMLSKIPDGMDEIWPEVMMSYAEDKDKMAWDILGKLKGSKFELSQNCIVHLLDKITNPDEMIDFIVDSNRLKASENEGLIEMMSFYASDDRLALAFINAKKENLQDGGWGFNIQTILTRAKNKDVVIEAIIEAVNKMLSDNMIRLLLENANDFKKAKSEILKYVPEQKVNRVIDRHPSFHLGMK